MPCGFVTGFRVGVSLSEVAHQLNDFNRNFFSFFTENIDNADSVHGTNISLFLIQKNNTLERWKKMQQKE